MNGRFIDFTIYVDVTLCSDKKKPTQIICETKIFLLMTAHL